MAGNEIGSAWVSIRPDMTGFETALAAATSPPRASAAMRCATLPGSAWRCMCAATFPARRGRYGGGNRRMAPAASAA